MIGRLGLPGIVIVIAVVAFAFCSGGGSGLGIDPGLDSFSQPAGERAADPLPRERDPDADLVDFLSFVLDDVQSEWDDLFRFAQRQYDPAELVLFEQSTPSGCGGAVDAIGPHYCPLDERVYLDLDFFRDLEARFGAEGDFAIAYVLAHEIGHHVQQQLGVMQEVQQAQRSDAAQRNDLSVRLELQADCFAGVWGYSTFQRDLLESGDLEEALEAAAAVGDDTIQRSSTGHVNPENWTHGSSDQRMRWFRVGYDSGDPEACDTFSGDF